MARRYVGVPTVGRPMQVFEKILLIVKRHKLTRLIPVVKFEKKARGQFYVFLAVEGAEGTHLPERVVTVLQDAGLRGTRYWPLEPDEVKPMTGQAELETHSLNALVYKSLWSNDAGDPFDLSEATVSEGHTADSELRRFLKKNLLIQDVGAGLIKMSYLGNAGWRSNRFSTACIAAFPSEMPFW